MASKSFHVVSRPGGRWSVKKSGEGRASRSFDSQSDAISFARSVAQNTCGEMIIHKRDGRIREKNSYGKDSCPPKRKR